MRKIFLLILLITLSQIIIAQYYSNNGTLKKERIPKGVKLATLMTASIILDAAGDALNHNGDLNNHKGNTTLGNHQTIAGHTLQGASVGTLILMPFVCDLNKRDILPVTIGYVSLRFGVFNPAYNVVRGKPITYNGKGNVVDKFMETHAPGGHGLFFRSLSFTFGAAFTIKETRPKSNFE